MQRVAFVAVVGLFTITPFARGQVSPDKALATFKVADGLQLETFASEPMFVNPTCIDVDWKGRVAEGALLRAGARIVKNREKHSLRVALFALDEQVWEREGCAAVKQLLRDLDGADVVTVVAASDSRPSGRDIDRSGSHPGRLARDLGLRSVLVVAAHDGATPGRECLTTWSNFGRETVDLAAPGRDVAAASPMGPIPAFGTSAAAALVAGAAALVAGDGRPSAAEASQWIREHVRKAPSLEGKTITGGVLDLAGLVKRVARPGRSTSRAASRRRRRASGLRGRPE